MTKEIIVNAGELESRVAILENGRLMELHVEREPKIVGNIYKGRVTKVLKGMDAAFVDIGIERNAFLAASDVVASIEDDSNGRMNRGSVPPITTLLKNNQEILCQVVRAPLGTKGARITTRLSLPGRYMVLMLNSGAHVGVSRKIEDPAERQRLRALANEVRPENYSLIVRTEAEGKSEEELRQDITFLVDMAKRIEKKAASSPTPSLIHGDLTLIFRLIRDAFTRDVNRLVVDSPSTYENVLELVGMLAPRMLNRVFLYDEALPIFHTYNIEPEIERTLRRKVWLPSGGSLIIDQAEALTAIDVNTGRFVGSVELAETVFTTNLQACDEVARQLRLRDLGGIIVVDFIDMDNPKHRQQVMKTFEESLKRDRAKLKVHSISSLGLVEMTRKRTGESLVRLLTEPCPYCSGIGRVQNSLTMALTIERELAATSVEHPETEAYQLTAHSRVIASMLGYEGEAQRDLEQYLMHPVYLRSDDNYHPNAYRLERLTLEQALAAVKHLEDGEIVEAQVVNPDPEVSLSPLALARGIYLVVADLDAPVGARVKLRVKETGTSLAFAEPLAEELRGIRSAEPLVALSRPPLVPESALPRYLRDERRTYPPREIPLLSPTSESIAEPLEDENEEERTTAVAPVESLTRRKRGGRRRKGASDFIASNETLAEGMPANGTVIPPEQNTAPIVLAAEEIDVISTEEIQVPETAALANDDTPTEGGSASARRRRRRRRRGGQAAGSAAPSGESLMDAAAEDAGGRTETALEPSAEISEVIAIVEEEKPTPSARRRNRRRRGGDRPTPAVSLAEAPMQEPIFNPISAESATESMQGLLAAIPASTEESSLSASAKNTIPEPIMPEVGEPTVSARQPRRRRAVKKPINAENTELPSPAESSPAVTLNLFPASVPEQNEADVESTAQAVDLQPETTSVVEENPKRRRTPSATPRRRTKKVDAPPETDTTQ